MRSFIIGLICVAGTVAAKAQQVKGKVSVTITDEHKTVLEGATAELRRSKDSGLIKTAVSDKSGVAEFEPLVPGSYLIKITAVNNQPYFTRPFTLSTEEPTVSLGSIQLTPKAANQMQGVQVAAKKPFIQRLNDRLVVNVESSIIGSGASAFEVLEMSPGVTIDQNDVISMRGRAGVIIMIDGKLSPMTGAELANYLKGLPSNAIERIDLITNPSAKYDASGNSGIIDIRLKKDQRLGTNGSFTMGTGQGRYPKANAGGSLNYRNKTANIFGSYNYNFRKGFNHLVINRNFFEKGVFDGSDNKNNYGVTPVQGHSARIGADFFPAKNTIIGFVVNSSFTGITRRADINTVVNNLQQLPEFSFYSLGTNNDDFNNTVANINFKQKLDSTGKELTADVDYGVFNSSSLTRTASYFYNLDRSKRREDEILDGDQQGKLTLRTAKVDYVNPLKKGARFEIGAKTSYVSSDNDAKFFNVFGWGQTVDAGKTNRFFYNEYNNAAYINFSKELKKFNFQFGLRGEHTALRTRQEKGDIKFRNDYFQLFPSAYFNYKINENQTLGVSVSRRIDRPGYSQLNPFLFQVDATIYSTGEPLLRPQTTWAYEMNYTVKQLNFSLSYSHTKNPQNSVLARILDVIPNFVIPQGQDSNITVQIPVNLQSSDYFGLTATLPVRINKWWNMMNNINVFYNHFNGNISGNVLRNGTPAANIRSNNSFSLKKGWSAELNASLNTGGRYGYMVMEPNWGVAVGAQKIIMQGKGTLRFNVTDIFWTNLPRAKVTYEGSYVENWHAFRETRVANLTFTYRFGNNKVQGARRRTTASEEERQRAGGN